jgi:hypothetical protein
MDLKLTQAKELAVLQVRGSGVHPNQSAPDQHPQTDFENSEGFRAQSLMTTCQ